MPLTFVTAALLLAAPPANDSPSLHSQPLDSPAANAPSAAKPMCQTGTLQPARAAPPVVRARKLGELPPAAAVLTVLRSVDGCSKPVIVRENIGANGR